MTDIEQALQYIDCSTLSYTEWIQVGMAIKGAGLSVDVWDAWSATDRSRYHAGECGRKWNSFRGNVQPVTQAYIFKLAKDNGWRVYEGKDEALDWDGEIEFDGDGSGASADSWSPVDDLTRYLRALYKPDEKVSFVCETMQDDDGKYKPGGRGCYWKTCGELLQSLEQHPDDICKTIGDYNPDAGAWIRFNPVNGEGVGNGNVTAYRYALVESDAMPLDEQRRKYKTLNLPIAAMVSSGGKSIHAIVKIDAANLKEYQERVDMLYGILADKGVIVDIQNKNPSRLSRMPGCMRGGKRQCLIETNIGCATWEKWIEYVETLNLPNIILLSDALMDPPPLADELIEGILRKGHKMLISGPSKAGKSFFLMELAIALACGQKWIGFQCRKSRVLYINFEIDPASCINRFIEIRKAICDRRGQECGHMDDLLVWNLRGYAMGLDKLVPKLVEQAKGMSLDAILVDPIYKVITGDENNASDMSAFCNEFDKIATQLKCAVIYCHHHSKGQQGQKKAMDRASGSGVFARDPDAQIDMLEIETKGAEMYKGSDSATAWQIESSLREFRNFKPLRIWFDYPLHDMSNGELDDNPVKGAGGRSGKLDDGDIDNYFDDYVDDNGFANIEALAKALDVSRQTLINAVKRGNRFDIEPGRGKGVRRI